MSSGQLPERTQPLGTPIVRGVHHVALTVHDLGAALAFYCDVLGCVQIERPDVGVPGAWLRTGSTEVHLIVAVDGAPPAGPVSADDAPDHHVAFLVDDVGVAVEQLRGHGIEPMTVISTEQAFAVDPSGNLVELATGLRAR